MSGGGGGPHSSNNGLDPRICGCSSSDHRVELTHHSHPIVFHPISKFPENLLWIRGRLKPAVPAVQKAAAASEISAEVGVLPPSLCLQKSFISVGTSWDPTQCAQLCAL